jgi:hypothetical protein
VTGLGNELRMMGDDALIGRCYIKRCIIEGILMVVGIHSYQEKTI